MMTTTLTRITAAALTALLLTALSGTALAATPVPVSATAPAPSSEPGALPRLESGDLVVARGDDGPGRIEVTAGAVDSVLGLARDGRVVRAIYVRAGETAVYDGVPNGIYDVFVTSGSGWNDAAARFTLDARHERWPGGHEFTAGEDAEGSWSTVWTFTLDTVPDGNVTPEPITEALLPV